MSDKMYGKELAQYKLERAKEELDTANLLFDNSKLKAANNIHLLNRDTKNNCALYVFLIWKR